MAMTSTYFQSDGQVRLLCEHQGSPGMAAIATHILGVLTKLLVEEGQAVETGALLAVVESMPGCADIGS
jgi:biotin carboxyl carrier protein